MAELADAEDSKSADLRVLGVRLPLPAPALEPVVQSRQLASRSGGAKRPSHEVAFLFLVAVEEIAWVDFQSAGELKNVVEADVLLAAFYFAHKIPVDLDHLAELF